MTRVRALLLLALVAVLALVAAYAYGRSTCPPPDWWFRIFVFHRNYGCVFSGSITG